jgi:threonine/homoserine/homoserine lactone efflux protein
MTFGWLSVYAAVVQRLGRFLDKSGVHRALEAVTGTVLVGLGVRLAAETRG